MVVAEETGVAENRVARVTAVVVLVI